MSHVLRNIRRQFHYFFQSETQGLRDESLFLCTLVHEVLTHSVSLSHFIDKDFRPRPLL